MVLSRISLRGTQKQSSIDARAAQPFGQADPLRAAPSAGGLPQTLGHTNTMSMPLTVERQFLSSQGTARDCGLGRKSPLDGNSKPPRIGSELGLFVADGQHTVVCQSHEASTGSRSCFCAEPIRQPLGHSTRLDTSRPPTATRGSVVRSEVTVACSKSPSHR